MSTFIVTLYVLLSLCVANVTSSQRHLVLAAEMKASIAEYLCFFSGCQADEIKLCITRRALGRVYIPDNNKATSSG